MSIPSLMISNKMNHGESYDFLKMKVRCSTKFQKYWY